MNNQGTKPMNWILIAIVSGLLTTGQYSSEEACLGKKAMMEKDKVTNVKCVDMSLKWSTTNTCVNCVLVPN